MELSEKISGEAINEIEAKADIDFAAIPIPHKIKDVAIWHLLTVSEDWQRMLFTKWIDKPHREIEAIVDQLKYALRHCLERVTSDCPIDQSFPKPTRTVPSSYTSAHELLAAGMEYAKITSIFTSIRSGRSALIERSGKKEIVFEDSTDPRYSALEMLGHGQEPTVDASTILYALLSEQTEFDEIDGSFASAQRIRHGNVVYTYEPGGILALVQNIPQRPFIIPDEFEFPWGSAYDTHALINSLQVRCLYHLASIYFATKRYPIKGAFESSLVLGLTWEQLIYDLSFLADFGAERIGLFVDFLTYGRKTKTPDPALQPIISSKNGMFLIPCLHVITSNIQRNLLSLLARTEKKNFDAQSTKFERSMCADMAPLLKKWPGAIFNRIYEYYGQKEELDIVMADSKSKFIFVLELRWMIQPGDPREVMNRIKVCGEKVSQLRRKIAFLQNNVVQFLIDSYNINETDAESAWKINGAVVLQGFGGRSSGFEATPLVTLDALKVGIAEIGDLENLYNWVASLAWLPREGQDFSMTDEEITIANEAIHRPGFFLDVSAKTYLEHLRESAQASARVCANIRLTGD